VETAKEIYICDVGLNPKIIPDFLFHVERLARASSVTYIDHHPLHKELRKQIESKGVEVIHSVDECAGVLTYMKFQDSLPSDAFLLACYAAVTDYMDTQPMAKRLMHRFDRQFILFEATMMSYALSRKYEDQNYLRMVVDRLSQMELPIRLTVLPNVL